MRRALAPTLLGTLFLLCLLLIYAAGGDSLTGLEPDPAILRGQARLFLWTVALMIVVPASIGRAAGSGAAQAHRDAPWLRSRATGPGATALATWTGQLLGAALLLAGICWAGEACAAKTGVEAPVSLLERPASVAAPRQLLPAGGQLSWTVPESAAGDQHHLRAALAASGDSDVNRARLTLEAHRANTLERPTAVTPTGDGEQLSGSERLLTETDTLIWTSPAGAGPLELTVFNAGPATLVIGGPAALGATEGLSHWRPVATDSDGPRTLILLWLLALAPALALAQGLGSRISPASATLLLLCLGLAAALASPPPGSPTAISWPGSGLREAMLTLGSGRSPAPPGPLALVGAVLWTIPGLVLVLGRRP
jgi:hypothetical protein